jgi:hypothetical protein
VESLFELEWALCLTHHAAGSTNVLISSPEIEHGNSSTMALDHTTMEYLPRAA